MPIENRDLPAGTVLKARHKGKEHTCEVVKATDGLRYRLKDGREFSSPSSAGRKVTGNVAVNGWRFWSLEGDVKSKEVKSAKPATKMRSEKKATKVKNKKVAKKKVARVKSSGSYGCGVCSGSFPTMKAATKHGLAHTTA